MPDDNMPEFDPQNQGGQDSGENAARPEAEKAASIASLKDQLEAAIGERDENRNKWLRAEAELDNYRKRVQKEAEEFRKYQVLSLAREILPGLDNLGRALAAAESSKNIEDLLQGVSMVARQFEDILNRHSIKPIEALGKPFDPNLHEALGQVPSEYPATTVAQELEKGYTLHDRVVRPTKVFISSGPPEGLPGE
jgi:molecular chaperone GrpE